MKAVIIAHGELKNSSILEKECSDSRFIICADGGAEYAFKNNIKPDFLIGDFDSIDKDMLDYFKSINIEIVKFPKEKDYTDTEICINKAVELGCSEICILAGVGGRIDHSLGNLLLLSHAYDKGIKAYIASDESYIYVCRDEIILDGRKGDIISIVPLRGDAKGIYTTGLKYSLSNGNILFGTALGISNEMIEDRCRIKILNGEIFVIKTENL